MAKAAAVAAAATVGSDPDLNISWAKNTTQVSLTAAGLKTHNPVFVLK